MGRGRPEEPVVAADDDMGWFWPPSDVHSADAWDRYWNDQVTHGLAPPLFDFFNFGTEKEVVRTMLHGGMRTVLCAGSGISQEPRALAEAGFEVTVLDLSPVALRLAQAWQFDESAVGQFFPAELRRPGGRVQFVAGDLLDPALCRGPFDVVIERRTLQFFPPDELPRALEALAARLSTEGILVSHYHNGGWRPPEPRVHGLKKLFLKHGWDVRESPPDPKPKGRVAWLIFSTG
jgi:hypothetical protein